MTIGELPQKTFSVSRKLLAAKLLATSCALIFILVMTQLEYAPGAFFLAANST